MKRRSRYVQGWGLLALSAVAMAASVSVGPQGWTDGGWLLATLGGFLLVAARHTLGRAGRTWW